MRTLFVYIYKVPLKFPWTWDPLITCFMNHVLIQFIFSTQSINQISLSSCIAGHRPFLSRGTVPNLKFSYPVNVITNGAGRHPTLSFPILLYMNNIFQLKWIAVLNNFTNPQSINDFNATLLCNRCNATRCVATETSERERKHRSVI